MDERARPSIRSPELTLRNWLIFQDRLTYFDAGAEMILTQKQFHVVAGIYDDVGWEREDWQINALLLPLDGDLQEAVRRSGDIERYQAARVEFRPGWSGEQFNFADRKHVAGLTLEPWLLPWQDPISLQRHIDIRPDFSRYHLLRERTVGQRTEYRHPIEDSVVIVSGADASDFGETVPFASVHRSYLIDYLAARRAALLVGCTADRFVIVKSDEDAPIDEREEFAIADHVSLLPTVQRTWNGNTQVRVTLYQTALIAPSERPATGRTAWPYFGRPNPDEANEAPQFVVGADGERRRAAAIGREYLYFQPRVLDYYLRSEGYRAYFHMRTWGTATGPQGRSVDVGINDRGIITAFAPDIAALHNADQMRWASCSIAPNGDVCREMFQTRMQNDPPRSPGVNDLLEGSREMLSTAWRRRFGSSIFRDLTDAQENAQARAVMCMSVGPLGSARFEDVARLAKAMYEIYIDALDLAALRSALEGFEVPHAVTERQLVLLRRVLAIVMEVDEATVRPMLAPCVLANELRVIEAHSTGGEIRNLFTSFGVRAEAMDARAMWDALVDKVAESLTSIAAHL